MPSTTLRHWNTISDIKSCIIKMVYVFETSVWITTKLPPTKMALDQKDAYVKRTTSCV